jgi:hypothetical protein
MGPCPVDQVLVSISSKMAQMNISIYNCQIQQLLDCLVIAELRDATTLVPFFFLRILIDHRPVIIKITRELYHNPDRLSTFSCFFWPEGCAK